MLPVDGKPILRHIIELARVEGCKHFILAIHYLGDMIEEYYGDGNHLDVQIDYLLKNPP